MSSSEKCPSVKSRKRTRQEIVNGNEPKKKKKRALFNIKRPNPLPTELKSSKSSSPVSATSKLRDKMSRKIDGARFRWINEQLYTGTGDQAKEMFDKESNLFDIYHKGFAVQVSKWPINPLDQVISYIRALPNSPVIADFGCGEAKLAQSVPNVVHSFDLVAVNSRVTPCNMANVPLPNSSVDVCVFCLSLMGTNISDFIKEARRVLKKGGCLKVCEVASRFPSEKDFSQNVEKFGFELTRQKLFSKLFFNFEFRATERSKRRKKGKQLPVIVLKPCIYKRR